MVKEYFVKKISYNKEDELNENVFATKKEMIVENGKENDCPTVGDWLRVYNVADVVAFIEAYRKMVEQYYPDKIVGCKDAVSIPGISMTYVLKKSLKKNKGLESYSPGGICHLCRIYMKSSSTVFVMVL